MTPETDDNYGLPAPIMAAMRALQQDQNRLTGLFKAAFLSLRVPSPGRMTMAYTMANELVGHCQLLGVMIDELRRFRGEGDGAYQPAIRQPRDTRTLRPLPTIKKPPGGIGGSVGGRPAQRPLLALGHAGEPPAPSDGDRWIDQNRGVTYTYSARSRLWVPDTPPHSAPPGKKVPGFHALYKEEGTVLGLVIDGYQMKIMVDRDGECHPEKPAKKPAKKAKATKKAHYCIKDVRDPNGIMSGCLNRARLGSYFCHVHQPAKKATKKKPGFVAGWTKAIARKPAKTTTLTKAALRASRLKARQARDAIARDVFLIDQGDDE